MKLTSRSLRDGEFIPERYAFGAYDQGTGFRLSTNESPQLAFEALPPGTSSLVLMCMDLDAPTSPEDVNKEGRIVPAALPRCEFSHLVLVDIPRDTREISEGELSRGVTAHGKDPQLPFGRVGLNDYTTWFEADPEMAGDYYGYDGPCPPWNDERVHRYVFRLFATELARLAVVGRFTAKDALRALEGHILEEATLTGLYKILPEAKLY